jgi:3-hydroxyacyl-CoA dehydrogenase
LFQFAHICSPSEHIQVKGFDLPNAPETDIAILGAGFIGLSFAAVFADAGLQVTLSDPDPARRLAAHEGIQAQREAMEMAGLATHGDGEITVVESANAAVPAAGLVIECGPEHLETKQAIFADLLGRAGEQTILATASSAIPMSQIVAAENDQARCLVAHPINPPAVLRIIELCPAPGTTSRTMTGAAELFDAAGFRSATVGHEIEGFILNRLQGALLREAYRLVSDGVAEPDDIDAVVRVGLGPRWALSGPFETAELNTPGGIKAHAKRMGPAYKRMGESRGETVDWSSDLVSRVAASRELVRGGASIGDRARWRTRAVARLVAVRDKLMDTVDD